jgi:ATP-dependent DNA helicase RecG
VIHENSPLSDLHSITKDHASGLLKLNIKTVKDLLRHLPVRYADMREIAGTQTLQKGQAVTLFGVLDGMVVRRSFKGHIPLTEGYLVDNSGKVRLIWFNQAYIGKMYPSGTKVKISGIVQEDKRGFLLSNPSIEKIAEIPETSESLFAKGEDITFLTPVYRETKGVTSNYLYTLIKKAVASGVLSTIVDPIPEHICKKLHLPTLADALMYIHFPKNEALTIAARKRFAFEEIFYLQVKQYKEKMLAKHSLAYGIAADKGTLKTFVSSFPFTPTNAQYDAIQAILDDIKKKEPMGRLLEGDVGSGKTFVAAVVAYATLSNFAKNGKRLQVAYMAPTEILAKQHFESFITYFNYLADSSIEIGLLTGSGCKKFPSKSSDGTTSVSRKQLLTWVADGRVSMVIGTHALIQKSVTFSHLALIIIDEQHRFGVKQRKLLTEKKGSHQKEIPHLLSMTATPIPRTLALTMFGDLELTVIDTLPENRKRIITEIVLPSKRSAMYEHVRKELQNGRQVYVICPRIDEQDEEEAQKRTLKSVKEEAKRLAEIVFPEFVVDIMHSKMKRDEKEEVMQDFLEKKSDILVSTSVVEVGVNVPNASVIIIEHADRFGLAQLHQLRGRVGRDIHQSYCYLFTENTGEMTTKRLQALVRSHDGFSLAEQDMLARGIGTLMDGKQWGMSDLAMESIKNPKLVEVARTEARTLVEADETLENHPLLKTIVDSTEKVHME